MKIFAVMETGDRYEIPDSSLLRSGQPFFVPDFAEEFRAMPSAVFRIGRLGKGIAPRFASRYVDAVTMGCAVIASDLLQQLRSEGRPWCRAVAFDKCCMIGGFMKPDWMPREWNVRSGNVSLTYSTESVMSDIGETLADISRDITVKDGDLILASLHPDGLILTQGSRLTITDGHNNNKILDISIR